MHHPEHNEDALWFSLQTKTIRHPERNEEALWFSLQTKTIRHPERSEEALWFSLQTKIIRHPERSEDALWFLLQTKTIRHPERSLAAFGQTEPKDLRLPLLLILCLSSFAQRRICFLFPSITLSATKDLWFSHPHTGGSRGF